MLKARNEMGLTNIELMIPFVRTIKEAEAVINILGSKMALSEGKMG